MTPETKELKPAICVIGSGPGGLAVAAAAGARDVPTVLIEKGRMGGESLNRSSIPAQALIAAADTINAFRGGEPFGIKTQRVTVDFGAVHAHVRDVVDTLAPNAARERMTGLGVHVIEGTARFTDPQTVAVGDLTVKARRFVISTGSIPVIPAIPGLFNTPYLTEESVFNLAEIPRHLIVIGAGATGLELAQVFRRLGSEVTVLDAATPLRSDDPEGAAVVLDVLTREGIKLRTGIEIAKVSRALAKVRVVLGTDGGAETIEGSHLLITAGRQPNLEDLDLDVAGIRTASHGIILDKSLRTTNKSVYAVGDAAGGPKYAHVADYHASLVIRHALFRVPVRVNHETIPVGNLYRSGTGPGRSPGGGGARPFGAIRVLRWPYRENDRAQVERMAEGHIKIITDRAGEILGVTIVGPNAGEAIAAWTLAIREKLNIRRHGQRRCSLSELCRGGKTSGHDLFH